MSLYEAFYEECVKMTPDAEPDGEGGQSSIWTEGAVFKAAIVHNSTTVIKSADKQGLDVEYRITTDKSNMLAFHDAIKRVSDGKIFRVTSNGVDVQTPTCATFSFTQFTAEEWRLPVD